MYKKYMNQIVDQNKDILIHSQHKHIMNCFFLYNKDYQKMFILRLLEKKLFTNKFALVFS